MKHQHNQILTDGGEIEIGRNYAYFEEFPNAIACVKALEDNSDDEFIRLKLEVIKPLHLSMKEGHVFECSAKKGFYSYPGMWLIKHFNIANVLSAMSPPKDGQEKMDDEYVKNVCKPGAGNGKCCRYLTMGTAGFECANLDSEMKVMIDERADSGKMNAIGKNCEGYGKEKRTTEGNTSVS
jgi:hypothetical protein